MGLPEPLSRRMSIAALPNMILAAYMQHVRIAMMTVHNSSWFQNCVQYQGGDAVRLGG